LPDVQRPFFEKILTAVDGEKKQKRQKQKEIKKIRKPTELKKITSVRARQLASFLFPAPRFRRQKIGSHPVEAQMFRLLRLLINN